MPKGASSVTPPKGNMWAVCPHALTTITRGWILKRKLALTCAVLAATFMLQGCETLQGTWKSTKEYYKEYINVDPQVDLEQRDYDSREERMAALFSPVDTHLESLSIYVNRQDRLPGEKWIDGLFSEYSWVNGVAASMLDGDVILRRPDAAMKPLNIAPLLEDGDALRDRKLRVFIDKTPLGPEMYMGTALFKGNDLAGIVAVHFDMRSVINFCPQPGELVVFTPEQMLWEGDDKAAAEALHDRPWDELLAQQSAGTITIDSREYDWLSRYIGDKHIVYAVRAPEGSVSDSGSFWNVL